MSKPTYSQIISPSDYCREMNRHHHMAECDKVICEYVLDALDKDGCNRLLEVGCGPARLGKQLVVLGDGRYDIRYTGVDHDPAFIAYAKKIFERRRYENFTEPRLFVDKVETWTDPESILADIVVSQGVHHHIPKGARTEQYLKRVFDNLRPGGIYILSDEFLAEYNTQNPTSRQEQCVLWYSYIVGHALEQGYTTLAVEEAKTLLDDLAEGQDNPKSEEQIEAVLQAVPAIKREITRIDMRKAYHLSKALLTRLSQEQVTRPSGNRHLDLSRGDYKVCGSVVRKEVEQAGFIVNKVCYMGPFHTAGGFYVHSLRKPA